MTPARTAAAVDRRVDRVAWYRSFVVRFVGVYVLMTIALVVVSLVWLHDTARRDVVDKFGLALESMASAAAPLLSAADLAAVDDDDDVRTEEFTRLRAALAEVRRRTGLDEDQIYVLRPVVRESLTFEFVVMLQERTFIGDRYRPPPEVRADYRRVLHDGVAVRTHLYTDENGSFISGLAPVFDVDGRVVALLQIDKDLDQYLEEVDRRTDVLAWGAGAFIVLVLLFGAALSQALRRKAAELLKGTSAIEDEQYDFVVAIKGLDELGTVARALNRVMPRLKERFEMLRFLPEHTAKMIANAAEAGGVRLDSGRHVEIAILETDIRGFTTISQSLSPEEVIGMLNRYIRVQAEILKRAGGSIDKYMGDAVLAIFEGEGKEQRALGCAIEIQREVARLNDEGAFAVPVHVGAGLSVGEVVMGNMGSEERMEHTVIGSPVNLAARLCSAAAAGEIVASAALFEPLRDAMGIDDAEPEEVKVKGFDAPVRCYRIRAGTVRDSRVSVPGPSPAH